MLQFLNRLSAAVFYPLCATFFIAYLGVKQEVAAPAALWWLGVFDLPLLLSGVLYGASSVVLSVTDHDKPSAAVVWSVFLPAVLIVAAVLALNFGFSS